MFQNCAFTYGYDEANLNATKDDTKISSKANTEVDFVNLPEVNSSFIVDEAQHGCNNNRGEHNHWSVMEEGCQKQEGEHDCHSHHNVGDSSPTSGVVVHSWSWKWPCNPIYSRSRACQLSQWKIMGKIFLVSPNSDVISAEDVRFGEVMLVFKVRETYKSLSYPINWHKKIQFNDHHLKELLFTRNYVARGTRACYVHHSKRNHFLVSINVVVFECCEAPSHCYSFLHN